ERYIEEHAHEAISIVDMAEHAVVSSRSLFTGFRRYRNTSPMLYLKEPRLRRVNEELKRLTTGSDTVTAVAFRWGFSHLRHFTTDYKRRFGESPSETLPRRARHFPPTTASFGTDGISTTLIGVSARTPLLRMTSKRHTVWCISCQSRERSCPSQSSAAASSKTASAMPAPTMPRPRASISRTRMLPGALSTIGIRHCFPMSCRKTTSKVFRSAASRSCC